MVTVCAEYVEDNDCRISRVLHLKWVMITLFFSTFCQTVLQLECESIFIFISENQERDEYQT